MASSPRKLIVTGATGKQGGALISALVAKGSDNPFEIYAVTRNKASGGAQALAKKPNVKVIEGDFKAPEEILKQVPGAWGLFSVTMGMDHKLEEEQGTAIATAALKANISHIIFTSVERGPDTPNTPTPIPHFASKHAIEKHIISLNASNPSFTYTFLQPVAFMDNITPDFFGKVFGSLWSFNGPENNLQLVGVPDIGRVGAEVFLNADSAEYKNGRVAIAGDELTPAEAKRIFKEVTGESLPQTFGLVGRAVKWMAHVQLGIMFDWFKTDGYGVDIAATKKRYPFIKDFRTWLVEESAWKKK